MDRIVLGPTQAQVGAQIRGQSDGCALRNRAGRVSVGTGRLLGSSRLRNTVAVLPRAAERRRR
eukprot:5247404-Heterocapsa_arctica.AAC.1